MANNLPPISSAYRTKLTSAIVSISVFFIVYFILILISLFMLFLLGYGAVKLISFYANYFTAVIALGMIGIGLVVFYFLIKFIFIKDNYSNRHLIEIDEKNQPELFAIINEIVAETKVQKPGKVFLSPEVNASVSYNSLFWSMFLPVKKNLTIGMGLINSTTVGELKTVLAHEFGHFSQRSMKIGGYVSQAEKIIFDTVYNNKDFENTIKNGSGHWVFQFTGFVSVGFISVFQYILKIFSDFLFKNNASLRREMEFHADAVATFVTNPKEQTSSLLRLDLSSAAFNSSFMFYTQSENKYLPENLFENQTILMKVFSERNNHPYENNLPRVDLDDLNRYNKTKIEIEDQWSFHPDTDKRIESIWKNQTKNHPENNELAKNIIRGFDEIGKALTSKYLTLYHIKNVGEIVDNNEKFLQLYNEKFPYHSIYSDFNGYYERHNPVLENLEELTNDEKPVENDLFNDKKVALIHEKVGIESDLYTLNQLVANPKVITTFKCNGRLYKTGEAKILISRFTKELETVQSEIVENDKNIFRHFYQKADENNKKTLLEKYATLAKLDSEYDIFQSAINNFIPHLQFMMVTLKVEEIRNHRANLLKNEKPFKNSIRHFIEESAYKDLLSIENRQLLKDFSDSEYIYFNNDKYIQWEVDAVFNILNEYQAILNKTYTDYKIQLIDFQVDLDKAS
ncbi:Zn-dependent protease with chaperone function [Chryseobacterium soldanellicola]|uniref:Zn-dependent protease with chaperone function n=1 Tax=Chryseobacterium soldanellicola TaxID=311333 RepID=A0A1H1GJJ5_9FLAO|nr:M48 family metallopeptidase [Chryseobacterium soldanellicola]SDR13056.1 Zn-dependent protease with chaperone function [Chryseobacterium soldanellicola]